MPFRPHSLPYKLRALFDAGVLSPEDLARSVGMPVSRVAGWLKGRAPDPVTRLQIDKVLSHYTRIRNRYLKLEDGAIEDAPPEPMPGVVEVHDAPAGLVEVKVRNNEGVRIGFFQGAAGAVDDEIIDALVAWHSRKCGTPLKINPAQSSSSSS